MPIASEAVVDALNATLATTKKAEACAMASQEEAGHVDAPCERWGLEVSAARGLSGRESGLRGNALSESRHRRRGGLFGVERR